MNRPLILATALVLIAGILIGCDSGGGKIEPLSGQGGPANNGKAHVGPHPMPNGAKTSPG